MRELDILKPTTKALIKPPSLFLSISPHAERPDEDTTAPSQLILVQLLGSGF